jgi:hypothetical protein
MVMASKMSAAGVCLAATAPWLVTGEVAAAAAASSSCELYMAESTALPGVMALFSGTDRTGGGAVIGEAELVLPVHLPNKNEYSPWHDFSWGPEILPPALRDGGGGDDPFQDVLVSGLGSLAVCSSAHANVEVEQGKAQRYSGGIASTDPAADAVSYYQDFHYRTTRDVAAGQELFLQCPDAYYDENLPSGGKLTRSVEELERKGYCVDNLAVARSSVRGIGRGAYSKRSVKAGDVVTATPLVHMDRSQVEIYEQEYRERHVVPSPRAHGIAYTSRVVGTQLMLNYCYGDKDSNVLLLPYAPGVNFINHSEKPNVAIRWATSNVMFDSRYLREQKPVMELYEMAAGSLVVEYVALTDIAPGDEIFLDYGEDWTAAWNEHVEGRSSGGPFRHEIGVPDGFYPANWNRSDPRPLGDFIASPLAPNMMAPIRWGNGGPEHAQVVTPWAFRIGLRPRVREVLLEYCNKMGITDVLKHVTVEGNGLIAGTDDHMDVEGDDWYIQRPGEEWRSNLHWFSPGAGPAHEHYLQALSVAGFDEVLEGVGEYLGMDGLVAFHVTFIGCSRSTKGFLHHDVKETGAKVYNVIIPLILANETGPELDLQSWKPDLPDELQEYKIGRYRYEYDVASMMGDNSYHATSAVDYRVNKEFRMAATVYIADVNDDNVRKVMQHYTQAYPPGDDIDLLKSWYGRHWKRGDPSRKLPKPGPDHILMRSRFASSAGGGSDFGMGDMPAEEL